MTGPLDLTLLNAAEPSAYSATLAPLFEGAPRFLSHLAAGRPDPDWPSLFIRARTIAHAMSEVERIELINAHPRLGAPPEAVSSLSFREQGYDREPPAGARTVAAELDRLNAAYEARFGFRYCVYVAGRSRAALLPEMAASLEADREPEMRRALDAVIDIAAARWSIMSGPG
ncbi:MAG: 2-oxo-4-hydroxy-4-carboxy-5-ureidoimidazoline decarboxylase [Chloroflexota bacterium]